MKMKLNPWTCGLLSTGLISLPGLLSAEEKPSSVLTALSATTLSGYIDTSAVWNPGTGNANVPGYAWNSPSKSDGFNLNVVKLTLEKPVEAADSWGAGYKVDLLFGPDASAFNTKSPVATGNSDFAVKQAYVALHAPVGNGLDFKLGVWDTIIGYEVFESINNPNVTRSYGYTMEPTTHTGLMATYQVNEMLSASAGIANTFGPQINGRAFLGAGSVAAGTQGPKAESFKTYMASLNFTAPTNWGALGGSSLTACVINGYDPAIGGTAGPSGNGFDQTSLYVGATFATPVAGLKVGACYDYAFLETNPVGAPVSSGYANAVGGYVSFQATEKLSLYGRGEYASSTYAATFGSKKVVELTATAQYDLWKNVMSRLEFRWDHSANALPAYGGTTFGLATLDNYYTIMANIAYKF
jgi:hypothetical protein